MMWSWPGPQSAPIQTVRLGRGQELIAAYRRSVLCPARWRVPAGALPTSGTPHEEWARALMVLRDRLGLPAWVSVGDADRQLRLNLDEPMDLALLREHLDQAAAVGESAIGSSPRCRPRR
jgi:hypothetical protein